jgi:hypothetical protein
MAPSTNSSTGVNQALARGTAADEGRSEVESVLDMESTGIVAGGFDRHDRQPDEGDLVGHK